MRYYITLTVISFFIAFLCFCGRIIFIHRKREYMIKNFDSYIAVLQYHMEKAYNMIHKDQILIYSIEATTLPDVEFHKASVDFIQLVQKLLGPSLTKEMVFLYGTYETFIFILAEYFNTHYDTDEIRKTSLDEVMNSEEENTGV